PAAVRTACNHPPSQWSRPGTRPCCWFPWPERTSTRPAWAWTIPGSSAWPDPPRPEGPIITRLPRPMIETCRSPSVRPSDSGASCPLYRPQARKGSARHLGRGLAALLRNDGKGRKRDGKGAALARGALDLQRAAHRVHEAFADGEA